MTQIDTACEHTKIRLIAAAIGHQQCTRTAASLIPLPGTDRVIAIGTAGDVARLLDGAHLASQSQAAQPSKQQRVIADAIRHLDAWLENDDCGCDFDGHTCGRDNVQRTLRELEELRNAIHLAGQSQATRAVPVAWMNPNEGCAMDAFLWQKDSANPQYSQPVYAAPTAQEVTQQAALEVQQHVAQVDGLADIARFWDGIACKLFGEKVDIGARLRDQFEKLSPVTQQAAKAETAEQASLLSEILTLAESGMCHGLLADDYCSQIVARIKALAPTTSTVSAPPVVMGVDLSSDGIAYVRNQALEEAAEVAKKCISGIGAEAAIRALRTTSGKGESA